MRRRCGCSSAPRSSTCRRHHQPLPHPPHHFTTFTLPSPGAPPQAHGGRHVEVARDLSHIGNVLCDLGKLDAVRRTARPQRPPSSAAAAASGCSAAHPSPALPFRHHGITRLHLVPLGAGGGGLPRGARAGRGAAGRRPRPHRLRPRRHRPGPSPFAPPPPSPPCSSSAALLQLPLTRPPSPRPQVLCTQRKWREALPMLQQAHKVLGGALDAQHPNLLAVGRFLSHCTDKAQSH